MYGPFNGDQRALVRRITNIREETRDQITVAVEVVMQRAAKELGIERPEQWIEGWKEADGDRLLSQDQGNESRDC
jgi:hypothetical protein